MEKEKKGSISNKIYLIICIVLVALSFIPVVGITAEMEKETLNLTYNGFELMFGKTINELSGYISVNANLEVKIKLNVMVIIVYFLPIIIFGIMKLLKKDNIVVSSAMIISFLISAVLSFFLPSISHILVNEYVGIGLLDTYTFTLSEVGFTSIYGSYIIGFILCASTVYAVYARNKNN